MKFSIIIPVYNVEKYIYRCLDSIKKQTYKNFEVIVVDDGSPDSSDKIISKFVKKDQRFRYYKKENGGLSDARNFGLNYVTGDYIIFTDSDDYLDVDLLKHLNEIITTKNYDVIKYMVCLVDDNGQVIRNEKCVHEGRCDFAFLTDFEYSEPAWTYAYKTSFWQKGKYQYTKGKIHEDYGLTPLILAQAESIYVLNAIGYYYVQRKGSIVNGSVKELKRAYDMLYHYDNIMSLIPKKKITTVNKAILQSFMANGIINATNILSDKKEKDKFIQELQKRKVFTYLLDNTWKRKIKKWLIKINPKLYINYISR